MLREKKSQAVDELQEGLSRNTIAIVTDYRGLSANQMTELRRRLRESGVEYKVVKNTLACLAAEKAGKKGIKTFFSGPTAIALSYDVVKPAQVLTEYLRTSGGVLKIKGAMIGERVLSPGDITRLLSLPSREILISQVAGGLRMPLLRLFNVLNAPLYGLMRILQTKIQQQEGGKDVRATS